MTDQTKNVLSFKRVGLSRLACHTSKSEQKKLAGTDLTSVNQATGMVAVSKKKLQQI